MAAAEQYSRAINSKSLRVSDAAGDADKLIAAGWAATGDDLRAFHLAMHRWMSGDLRGMNQVVDQMSRWITRRAVAKDLVRKVPSRPHAIDIARAVCAWWMHRVCPVCHGHGHPLIEGAPVLDETRVCRACNGSGQRNLFKGMTEDEAALAQWLVSRLEATAPLVFAEMSRRLRANLEF